MLGVGSLYGKLEHVVDTAVHRAYRPKIRELLAYSGDVTSEYEHRLFTCPRCNVLFARFYVKIFHDGKAVYESQFKCPKCRKVLAFADEENVGAYCCKSCGARTLIGNPWMCWD